MHQPSNAPKAENNDETLPSSGKQKKVQFDDELELDDETTHKFNIDDDQNNQRPQTAKSHTKKQLKDTKEIDQLNEDRKRKKQEEMNRQIEQLTRMVDNWRYLSEDAQDHLRLLAMHVEHRFVYMDEVPTILQGILDDVDRNLLLSGREERRMLTWAYTEASRQGFRADGTLMPPDDDGGSTVSSSGSRSTGNVATATATATSLNNNNNNDITDAATTNNNTDNTDAATTNNNTDNTDAATTNNDNDNTDAAIATNHNSDNDNNTNNNENKKPWWRRLWGFWRRR